ncbi:MAG: hypothetical protein HYR55_06495 [Acidobacteria bacterium]|nr:hypothetical protein [Acidobacteriota bacterium]MBI3656185.1 hypothetical protein [Acidobacteriota bacterium]
MSKVYIKIYRVAFLIALTCSLSIGYTVEAGVIDFKIKSIAFEKATMREALAVLRDYGIQVCLERVPLHNGEEETRISGQLSNVRVKDILEYLIHADPRYTYEIAECNIINIYPKNSKNNPEDLLNIKISEFEIRQYDLYNAITHIAQIAPELRAYLQKMLKPGGVPGSNIRGEMDSLRPKFSLKLTNLTVRDILNKIAEQSSLINSGNRDFPPIGWIYEFVIDESSPLGGYPTWRIF